jgi:hypothetical protein
MHRHTRRTPAAASLRLLAAAIVLLSLLGCSDAPAPPAEASGQLPQLERLPMIEGIDADGDGVRDDIADHIRKTYTDPVQYRAAMQVARAYQNQLLVDKHDHIALQAASEQMMRAIGCLEYAFPGGEQGAQRLKLLTTTRDLTTNTKERLLAYLAYNKSRSGSVSVSPEGNTCE